MNTIDLVVLIPTLYFLVRGFQKGIIYEITTIIALVLAIAGCLKLTHIATMELRPFIDQKEIIPYIAYVLIFICIFFLVQLLGRSIEKILKLAQLNIANRLLGAILGFLKVAFLCSLFFWITDQVDLFSTELKNSSYAYEYCREVAPFFITLVTDNLPFLKDIMAEIELFFDSISEEYTSCSFINGMNLYAGK